MKIINKEYDKKIYAFLFGIIVGTILFNMIGVDFSFSQINKFHIISFGKTYIFILYYLLKYFIVYYLLSLLSTKDKIFLMLLAALGLKFSGTIIMTVQTGKFFVIYSIAIIVIKIVLLFKIFEKERTIKNMTEGIMLIIAGSFLTDILFFI